METEEKVLRDSKRKYEKKAHLQTTLNVNRFLGQMKGEITQHSIEVQLIHYLKNHRDAEFESLQKIADVIRAEYDRDEKECTKGTISKVLGDHQGDWVFDDGVYFFRKIDGIYKLRPRFAKDDPLLEKLFQMKNAFKEKRIHELNRETFVFGVAPERANELKEMFLELLGTSLCFGIMTYEEHMIIMLDKTDSRVSEGRDLIRSFFKRKKEYEEALKNKELREAALREQDERIRKNQKYKKFNLAR